MASLAELIRKVAAENSKQLTAAKALVASLEREKPLAAELVKAIPNPATVAQATAILTKVAADAWDASDPALAAQMRAGKHKSSFEAMRYNIRLELEKQGLVL